MNVSDLHVAQLIRQVVALDSQIRTGPDGDQMGGRDVGRLLELNEALTSLRKAHQPSADVYARGGEGALVSYARVLLDVYLSPTSQQSLEVVLNGVASPFRSGLLEMVQGGTCTVVDGHRAGSVHLTLVVPSVHKQGWLHWIASAARHPGTAFVVLEAPHTLAPGYTRDVLEALGAGKEYQANVEAAGGALATGTVSLEERFGFRVLHVTAFDATSEVMGVGVRRAMGTAREAGFDTVVLAPFGGDVRESVEKLLSAAVAEAPVGAPLIHVVMLVPPGRGVFEAAQGFKDFTLKNPDTSTFPL